MRAKSVWGALIIPDAETNYSRLTCAIASMGQVMS